ncbi:protein kinase domain-containing protein, partial [Actinomadura geliboluensis]|uniref:protein kinase domain-containing protein n=1 Tax=Actinomadura geliboluensis TaxID=882440 RepID=UPI0033AD494A
MESGLRLTERYRLVERLGDGGTMEVWRALDELLDRPVAVKLPAPGGPPRAFQEGVNRAAGLSHPALETVYDSDLTRDAAGRLVPYLVTEFLDGESLADRLRRGRLTAREAASVCGRVAAALDAAHAAGVTHGDLRPGKIMLLREEVRLVDTGIGGIVRGAPAPVTAAADVRALGAVLAACLPSGTSGELPALAARCLSEDAPSAREVADALAGDDALAGGDVPPRRVRMAPAAAAVPQATKALPPPAPPRP